ncbi:SHOCT domain-containing protein, partial [Algibacter sp.]|uniref:SHOCT domain-containing protein n=1 Tax=Algibacter sp. TaxID=1872428 RepID=UPI003C774EBA
QNNTSYAIFNNIRRLAIQQNGKVTVFDTLDNQIGGVGQQQGGNYSVSFTSQYGNVDLDTLPIVSGGPEVSKPLQEQQHVDNAVNISPQPAFVEQTIEPNKMGVNNTAFEEDIFIKIEKLAALKDKSILSVEEFESKKAELLSRL